MNTAKSIQFVYRDCHCCGVMESAARAGGAQWKVKPISHNDSSANEKRVSERHGLLLCGKLSLQEFGSSSFSGRTIKDVRFQNNKVWVCEFALGPVICIAPIISSRGCNGLMAGPVFGGGDEEVSVNRISML